MEAGQQQAQHQIADEVTCIKKYYITIFENSIDFFKKTMHLCYFQLFTNIDGKLIIYSYFGLFHLFYFDSIKIMPNVILLVLLGL